MLQMSRLMRQWICTFKKLDGSACEFRMCRCRQSTCAVASHHQNYQTAHLVMSFVHMNVAMRIRLDPESHFHSQSQQWTLSAKTIPNISCSARRIKLLSRYTSFQNIKVCAGRGGCSSRKVLGLSEMAGAAQTIDYFDRSRQNTAYLLHCKP